MTEIGEYLLNGILFGSTYSLVAIEFTIIFGAIHRLNVAHGATIMVSAFAGATTSILLGGADSYAVLALSFAASVATGALLGVLVELVAFRPLRNASYLTPFVTTIAVSIILEELFSKLSRSVPIFYPEYTPFPSPLEDLSFNIGGMFVRGVYVATFVISLILMLILHFWITRTRSGRAVRVVEENPDIARLLGINVRRVEVTVFAVASALAGAAGCLIGVSVGTVGPFMGSHLLVIGFVAIVLGGLGNVYGAMLGGIIVGAVETLTVGVLSATYKEALLFAIVFAVLIFKPQGLLSSAAEQRD